MYPITVKQHDPNGETTIIEECSCSSLDELATALDNLLDQHEDNDAIGIYSEECVVKQAWINKEPVGEELNHG